MTYSKHNRVIYSRTEKGDSKVYYYFVLGEVDDGTFLYIAGPFRHRAQAESALKLIDESWCAKIHYARKCDFELYGTTEWNDITIQVLTKI